MKDDIVDKIIDQLKSKQKDCIQFSKKYQTRNMEQLSQYYEGAKWAFDYTLNTIKNFKESSSDT